MVSKIYAYLGMNSASIDFPTGTAGGSLKVEFTGGNIYDRVNYRPAISKPISDPVFQSLIEQSKYFGRNVIIYDVIDGSSDADKDVPKLYNDVTNFAEAVQILKSEYGIKAAQLKSPAGVRVIASSLNVEFPNWK